MSLKNAALLRKLREMYSEITVDHILNPRNAGGFPNPDGFAACRSGCSETMKIWLKVTSGRVEKAAFWTDGCAATVACGSMATEMALNKPVKHSLGLTASDIAGSLVDLPEGNFHCAELAAHALRTALKDYLSTHQQPWKKLYRT